MTAFTDLKQDTPRLVVMFKVDGGREMFQWGIHGNIPIMSLVGCLVRVQNDLPLLEPGDVRHDCPEQALVLAWDEETRRISWFVHRDVPVDAMLGMLETIKGMIITANAAQKIASNQILLGPDGRPARR